MVRFVSPLLLSLVVLGAVVAWPALPDQPAPFFNEAGSKRPVPDDLCLGCICEATTNCTLGFQCTRGLCGPFLISEPYWQDAGAHRLLGEPDYSVRGAYYRCATDNFCSATTVRSYLTKFAQDCDGNGIVDCNDYAKIHYMGGYQCKAPIENIMYYSVYLKCIEGVRKLLG